MRFLIAALLFVVLSGCASSHSVDHYYASNRLLDCRSVAEARKLYAPDASIRWSDVRSMDKPANQAEQLVEVTLLTSRAGGDRVSPTVTRDRVTCWFEQERLVALQLNGRELLGAAESGNLVFFDWDQYSIRPDGYAVIEAVAEQLRAGSSDTVVAIGHTDRSGEPSYNIGLSQRRAIAVKAALQRMGIPEAVIRTEWKGETRPLVPTPAGVREERNRRVEIVLAP